MQIDLEKTEIRTTNFLTKISFVLLGLLITSIVTMINLQVFNENGIITGIIANLILFGLGLRYSKAKSRTRLISWTILVCTLAITIGGYVILYSLKQSLQGL